MLRVKSGRVMWSESVAGKANSFSMKQGVLFHGRVHVAFLLEMKENWGGRCQAVQGCTVDAILDAFNFLYWRRGKKDTPGLTDTSVPQCSSPSTLGWLVSKSQGASESTSPVLGFTTMLGFAVGSGDGSQAIMLVRQAFYRTGSLPNPDCVPLNERMCLFLW